jgi:hypothetical protein
MSGITQEQYDLLLKDLAKSRIASRKVGGMSLSYLEAWDVRRTLIRVFGFGGFSTEVSDVTLVSCEKAEKNWDVSYQVTLRLTIPALGCEYAEAAVGSAHLPDKGEALDMAVKTAESDALKRAAVNLGTQFGLSLYNNGQTEDVVLRTLVVPTLGQEVEDISDLPSDVHSDNAPEGLDEQQETVLGLLRSFAPETDAAKRITGIAGIKAQYHGTSVLDGVTEVGGQTMTLAALADQVAAGAFVKDES